MLLHAVTWKAVVLSWPVPTNRNSASCSLLWKAVISVGQYYQQEFCFMQVGREGGGFSWPVPTNRNSASCRLVWKAVVSVGQYLPTGILLHVVWYGRRWFQRQSKNKHGTYRTTFSAAFLYTISYELQTGSEIIIMHGMLCFS